MQHSKNTEHGVEPLRLGHGRLQPPGQLPHLPLRVPAPPLATVGMGLICGEPVVVGERGLGRLLGLDHRLQLGPQSGHGSL